MEAVVLILQMLVMEALAADKLTVQVLRVLERQDKDLVEVQ